MLPELRGPFFCALFSDSPGLVKPFAQILAVHLKPFELALIDMPQDVLGGLRNYVGSVAANPAAGIVAVSSPQGNSMLVIDTATGTVRSSLSLKEVCGLAPDQSAFMATTGAGEILDPKGSATDMQDYVWDNHLLRIM